MVAILTDKLKRRMLDDLVADFNDSASYYFIGLGRAEIWNDSDVIVAPANTTREVRNFQNSLQGVKQIADLAYVAPRVNWSAGSIYSAWDDNQPGYPTNGYYVVTASNEVYICIQQGRNSQGIVVPSTVEPTGNTIVAFTTADGYVWKYLYSINSFQASRFLSANYIPVPFIDSANDNIEQLQKNVQNAAINGQVSRIVITNGGTGYSVAPTVSIIGDGDSATATSIISGGSVVRVNMTNNGNGYTNASVKFSSGTAAARAVISPAGGFGADARNDLKSTAIMLNGRPDGVEGGELLVNQDFRQIGVIRNIKVDGSESDFTQTAGIALRKLTFEPGGTQFTPDTIIVGGTSLAKGYIDQIDSAASVYYHQSETTGFGTFQSGEALTAQNLAGATVGGSAVLDSDLPATVNKYTGSVLYIDNRSAIIRSSGETQDIKIVIQL